jgi:hypothetical protein
MIVVNNPSLGTESGVVPPDPGALVDLFFGAGQSNAVRGLVAPIAGPNYPAYPRLYMPLGSQPKYQNIWTGQFPQLARPENILPFDPGTVVGLQSLTGNEFGTTQLEGYLTRYAALNGSRDVCGFVSAEGGADVEALSPGGSTGTYEKSVAMIQRLYDLLALDGVAAKVFGIDWNQGEANSSTADLGTLLQTLIYNNYNTDLKAITGQAEDLILNCVQPSSFGNSSSGCRSLLDKGLEGGNIICVGPTYWYPWNPADYVHHSDYGVFYMGELSQLCYAIKKATGDYKPLHITGATMASGGTTITATWNRDIMIHTTDVVQPDPRTFEGLQVNTGTGGSAVYSTILSHDISGNVSTIEIAAPVAGIDPQIRVAMVGQTDPEGRTEANIPRTNICAVDALGTSVLDGTPLLEWACHQQVFITVT